MPTLKLNFLVVPTYNTKTLAIIDTSVYPDAPFEIENPTIEICVPGFNDVVLPFTPNEYKLFTSENLGITEPGEEIKTLPDGIYIIKYSIEPNFENFVQQSIMRTDKIQEKFDEAFMKLDMMECDRAIKTQSKVELDSIYYFIQGAIAAANNCAVVQANKLYNKANRMLDTFLHNNCGCTGNNYKTNFH